MRKILFFLAATFLFTTLHAQYRTGIKGISINGIKGIKKSLADIIAYDLAHPIPLTFKARLRPELEGPEPRGQYPGAKAASKTGTLVNANNYRTTPSSAPTQSIHSNFLAIWGSYAGVTGRESPYTPPDNCGDVGTTQIIATANCRMKVFNKPTVIGPASTTPTGTSTTTLAEVVNVDLNTFFSNSALGINSISDPHVRYDRLSGRWFIVAVEVNHTSGSNYCCVAVSDGNPITPTSIFKIFYFSVAGTGGASNDFFDYPTLGVDKNSLYIGGNMFANGSSFSGSNIWVINKTNLIAGTLTVTSFPHGITNTDMYTPQGVHNDDPGAASGYFIGASQTFYSKLVIRRVSYSGSTPSLSGDLNLTTLQMSTPLSVPTLGGTSIDGGDRRTYAAMIKKNKITGAANLWVAQGTKLNSSGIGGTGDRDGALWLEIGSLATTPVILQSATLYDGVNASGSAIYYTYPTIAMSGQGHSVMGFTSAGPAKYAQGGAAGRYRDDPAGNFQSPIDLTNTTSTYNPGANRWGDYTQTVVDPTDDMTIWTFTEYVPTTNAWGVRAAQFQAPPPATPSLASLPVCGTTTTITINGTSTNNSEFFDPGNDTGGPGFNRLKVDVTGPDAISVSNIVFVNPTQINANFNVPANAVSGTYTVTVTNPDGQTATTTFNLNCVPPVCGDPTGLSSSTITNTSATVSWNAVANAISYAVDYRVSPSGNWIPATVTGTSAGLSGLTPGTTYDWRVIATCSGGSGNYVAAQFTTTAPCLAPTTLPTTVITSSSATVNWSAVSGAINYDVQYKTNASLIWVDAAFATTATSVSLSGLTASTLYDWQVRSHCSDGSITGYSSGQFNTLSVVICPDQYEPNETLGTAANIPVAIDIKAQIASSTDNDYYAFNNTSAQKKIKITLTNLPADYDMKLYKNSTLLATSANTGLTAEAIVYNATKVNTYRTYVYGKPGVFNNSQCYTLNIQLSATNFSKNGLATDDNDDIANGTNNNQALTLRNGLRLYPVPAANTVTVSFDAFTKGNAEIIIINQLGQKVLYKRVQVSDGINFNTIDITSLKGGVYTVKVHNGTGFQVMKMIIIK